MAALRKLLTLSAEQQRRRGVYMRAAAAAATATGSGSAGGDGGSVRSCGSAGAAAEVGGTVSAAGDGGTASVAGAGGAADASGSRPREHVHPAGGTSATLQAGAGPLPEGGSAARLQPTLVGAAPRSCAAGRKLDDPLLMEWMRRDLQALLLSANVEIVLQHAWGSLQSAAAAATSAAQRRRARVDGGGRGGAESVAGTAAAGNVGGGNKSGLGTSKAGSRIVAGARNEAGMQSGAQGNAAQRRRAVAVWSIPAKRVRLATGTLPHGSVAPGPSVPGSTSAGRVATVPAEASVPDPTNGSSVAATDGPGSPSRLLAPSSACLSGTGGGANGGACEQLWVAALADALRMFLPADQCRLFARELSCFAASGLSIQAYDCAAAGGQQAGDVSTAVAGGPQVAGRGSLEHMVSCSAPTARPAGHPSCPGSGDATPSDASVADAGGNSDAECAHGGAGSESGSESDSGGEAARHHSFGLLEEEL
mmetsp:Transcript_2736/g.7407  ORF Transcript_2736/g.7407 Transcript_2736/m.7407 type:complete len:479 (-) Transcript_2736:705-2141(-)